jgi:hypothetical protein
MTYSSHPFLSVQDELAELNDDIASARLEMLNDGVSERVHDYIDGLCKRRLELLDKLGPDQFRLPLGVTATAREDCDPERWDGLS